MWLIAQREFLERVRQRAFVIAIVIGAVVSAAAVTLPPLLTGDGDRDSSGPTVGVVVLSGDAQARLSALRATATAPDGSAIQVRPFSDGAELRAAVRDGDVDLGLRLGGDAVRPAAQLISREDGGGLVAGDTLEALQRTTAVARAEAAGVAPDAAARLVAPVASTTVVVEGAGPSAEAAGVAFVLTLIVYVAIIMLVQSFATGLVSDRSARVTERLLTAASPRDHLLGKLLGVGASGALQLGGWFVAALLADAATSGAGGDNVLAAIPAGLLLFFPFALLGAYVLYSAMAVPLVLPVRKPEDVGGAISATSMLTIVAFILATTIIAPGATVSPTLQALSLVPFFAPLLMLARLAGDDVAVWEFAVAALGPFVLGGLLLAWAAPVYARHALDPAGGKGLGAVWSMLRRKQAA